jgi:hypothetical protein
MVDGSGELSRSFVFVGWPFVIAGIFVTSSVFVITEETK